jgi:hypothetical protein
MPTIENAPQTSTQRKHLLSLSLPLIDIDIQATATGYGYWPNHRYANLWLIITLVPPFFETNIKASSARR